MARPSVSVAFPCYQQVEYVEAALASVLAQDHEPLEIVVSDDGSTDGTWETIERRVAAYQGPHAVTLHRNDTRQGIENYNTLMALTGGDIVVIAHSDDLSEPHRVRTIVDAFEAEDISLVGSNAENIAPDGASLGPMLEADPAIDHSPASLAARGWTATTHGATLAWKREVFDEFGPLDGRRTPFQSDWILPFRAALLGGVRYLHQPLVRRRVHDASRGNAYLHHQRPDPVAHREAVLATGVAQTLYRLHTLGEFLQRHPEHRAALQPVAAVLQRTQLRASADWAAARNQLALDGRRPRWESITSTG